MDFSMYNVLDSFTKSSPKETCEEIACSSQARLAGCRADKKKNSPKLLAGASEYVFVSIRSNEYLPTGNTQISE